MCEFAFNTTGERHGNDMVCVNRPCQFTPLMFSPVDTATYSTKAHCVNGIPGGGVGGGGARFSAPVQTDPGASIAFCTRGTESFRGVKRPGRGDNHLPTSTAYVKERLELYLNNPL
jgi:hypothetical protein